MKKTSFFIALGIAAAILVSSMGYFTSEKEKIEEEPVGSLSIYETSSKKMSESDLFLEKIEDRNIPLSFLKESEEYHEKKDKNTVSQYIYEDKDMSYVYIINGVGAEQKYNFISHRNSSLYNNLPEKYVDFLSSDGLILIGYDEGDYDILKYGESRFHENNNYTDLSCSTFYIKNDEIEHVTFEGLIKIDKKDDLAYMKIVLEKYGFDETKSDILIDKIYELISSDKNFNSFENEEYKLNTISQTGTKKIDIHPAINYFVSLEKI